MMHELRKTQTHEGVQGYTPGIFLLHFLLNFLCIRVSHKLKKKKIEKNKKRWEEFREKGNLLRLEKVRSEKVCPRP